MKLRKSLYLYMILFSLMLLLIPFNCKAATTQSDDQKRVLFISSYTLAWPTVPYQIRGIQETLGDDVALEYAFMGTKTLDDNGYDELFYERMKYLVAHVQKYDVIITGDDAAYNFAISHEKELFPDTPILYEGLNNITAARNQSDNPWVTGIIEQMPLKQNIDIALKIHPQSDTVVSLLDNSASGKADQTQLAEVASSYPDLKFTTINSSELSQKEIINRLSGLDQNAILIYMILSKDADGNIYTSRQAVDLIVRYSPVPAFRIVEAGIGDGLLGGEFVDHEKSGQYVGTLAMKYLSGESIADVPMMSQSPTARWFDWNVMKKFGIKASQLPADAVILNREPTFWEQHGRVVAVSSAIFVTATLFLIFLLRLFSEQKHNRILMQKNEELATAVTAATRASYAKSQFLSNMSHEIRTPMNAILGLTGIAKYHEHDAREVDQYLSEIEDASTLLLNIINNVLDMSAIENDKLKISEAPFSLNELLDSINAIYAVQCEEKKIGFRITRNFRTETVNGDRLRLNQILLNLISNAFKFTSSGGSITVQVTEDYTKEGRIWYEFSVRDTGEGMSEDMKERLFHPFEQESAVTGQQHGGTGLGLSITHNLVSLMKGKIRVESEKGKGTCFYVELPFSPASAPVTDSHTGSRNETLGELTGRYNFSGHRVLIAEDNALNKEIICELLRLVHLDFDTAENGQITVNQFVQSDPGTYDAILMDIRMPVMNGLEAARQIRACEHPDAASIPIYAMTANAFAEDVSASLAAGMNGHLSKPINTGELYRTLEQILNS